MALPTQFGLTTNLTKNHYRNWQKTKKRRKIALLLFCQSQEMTFDNFTNLNPAGNHKSRQLLWFLQETYKPTPNPPNPDAGYQPMQGTYC